MKKYKFVFIHYDIIGEHCEVLLLPDHLTFPCDVLQFYASKTFFVLIIWEIWKPLMSNLKYDFVVVEHHLNVIPKSTIKMPYWTLIWFRKAQWKWHIRRMSHRNCNLKVGWWDWMVSGWGYMLYVEHLTRLMKHPKVYDFQGLLFQIEDDALVVDLKSKTKTTPDLSQTHQILQIHKIRQIHHRLKMYCFVHSATLFIGVSQRSISCIEMMF